MPIRKELRHFYTSQQWKRSRREVLERSGGVFDSQGIYRGGAKCEDCGVPDRKAVRRFHGLWKAPNRARWRNEKGDFLKTRDFPSLRRTHWVEIQIAVTHDNHTAGDDRPENLKARCQWCHLNFDKGFHRATRAIRKDQGRPLLGLTA